MNALRAVLDPWLGKPQLKVEINSREHFTVYGITRVPFSVSSRWFQGSCDIERKPYSTRHTFISAGLSNGVNIEWLAEYCGTSVAMIEKHYGKFIGGNAEEQLSRLLGGKTGTLPGTLRGRAGTPKAELNDFNKLSEEKVGGPTWTRTRDQPVMSRWL